MFSVQLIIWSTWLNYVLYNPEFSVQADVSGSADSTMYCITLCLVYKLMYLEQLTQLCTV